MEGIDERLIPGMGSWRNYGLQHLQRYQFAFPHVRQLDVLDVACGVGYGSFFLCQAARSCQGIDLSPEAIGYANSHYRRANLRYAVGDALRLSLPAASVDAVVSFETIEHLPEPPAFLAAVHRILRPGGLLIVSAPNALQFTRAVPPRSNEFHVSEPTYEELVALLAPRFEILEEWEQAPVLPTLAQPAEDAHRRRELRSRLKVNRLLSAPHRWLEEAEILIRRILGKDLPDLPAIELPATVLYNLSAIVPLLPERRRECPQFLFVCRRRPDPKPDS